MENTTQTGSNEFRILCCILAGICGACAALDFWLASRALESGAVWAVWLVGMAGAFCLAVALWHLKNAIFED